MQDNNKDSKQAPGKNGVSWTHPSITQTPAVTAAGAQPRVARTVGIFAAGIIVGVLLSWGYDTAVSRSGTPGTNATSTQQTSKSNAGITIGTNGMPETSFSVEDPQKAGTKVVVTKVVVSKPTWVVVYEDNDGKQGRALGATLFSAQKQSGTVTLLRGTVAGNDYLVGQSVDDGNKTFSLKGDSPVMSGSEPLLVGFTAQ